MATIIENLTLINQYKTDIKNAISNKGQYVENDLSTYANAINNIQTGATAYTWDQFQGYSFIYVAKDNSYVLALGMYPFTFIPIDLPNFNAELYDNQYNTYVGSERRAAMAETIHIRMNSVIPSGSYSWSVLENTVYKQNPNVYGSLDMNNISYSFNISFNKWNSMPWYSKVYLNEELNTVVEIKTPTPRLFTSVPVPESINFTVYGQQGPQQLSPIAITNETDYVKLIFSGTAPNGYYSLQGAQFEFYEVDNPTEIGMSSFGFSNNFEVTAYNLINGEINIPTNFSIILTSNKSIDMGSASISLYRLHDNEYIPTNDLWEDNNRKITITPVSELDLNTVYRLVYSVNNDTLTESQSTTYLFTTVCNQIESL